VSDLPFGWVPCSLGEVARFEMGQAPPGSASNFNGTGTIFVKAGEFGRERPVVREWTTKPLKFATSSDVLICVVGATAGKLNLGIDSAIGRSVAAIKPLGPLIQKAIYYQLLARVEAMRAASTGSAQGVISKDMLSQLEIVVPPLAEQKRIADKLDTLLAQVDACRGRLGRLSELIRQFRQSVLAAATSGQLTEEWRNARETIARGRVVQLGDVARDFGYGSAAKSNRSGLVPVLRMGNIQDGAVRLSDLVYTSDAREIAKYLLSPGDVLFNRTNSPELVGKTAVFWGEHPAIFAGYLIRVRCGETLLPDYLNYCLGAPAGREYCWRVKSDGVSQSNINAKKLAAFEFYLPSVEEQVEIVRKARLLLACASAIAKRVDGARNCVDRTAQAALETAFSGGLVPQDPRDESARALLNRVKSQSNSLGIAPGQGRSITIAT
jgi:type I restriction enzyme S subunit